MRFQVVGNRMTLFETLLWESDSLTEAKRWLDGYVKDNNHGYAYVEVVEAPEDVRCKTIVHYIWESEGNVE